MSGATRRAALDLVAAALEEMVDEVVAALRDGGDDAYTAERPPPLPEEGDELSGLAYERALRAGVFPPTGVGDVEQDGQTEAEREAARL